MYFSDASKIRDIAAKNGTSIFVVPGDKPVKIKDAILLQPEDKKTITIGQVREVMSRVGLRETRDRFIVIRPADLLGVEAANAMLKNLEEPGEKIHYILITDKPSRLLPTILSRAAVYFLRDATKFNLEIEAQEDMKKFAKKLIAAKPHDLVVIADSVAAKKKTARSDALDLLALSIEMLYKSYFITGKDVFIKKIPKFLAAYDNIRQNGHVKLHMVADLC